jgi:hypothetical protein
MSYGMHDLGWTTFCESFLIPGATWRIVGIRVKSRGNLSLRVRQVQSCLVESNVITPKLNRLLPGKDDWSVRCSQWHERLSEEQIKYAALDAIVGSCIDHVLNNTPDKV